MLANYAGALLAISIHAPREGGDVNPPAGRNSVNGFQSTPPARGATAAMAVDNDFSEISIHAPREGGDKQKRTFGLYQI